MRRRTVLLWIAAPCLFAALLGIPTLVRTIRQCQFNDAQQFVQNHGGSLDFDLVDGNYMVELRGDAATDETIRKLVPTLKRLPTGFTVIGPGEERSFWVSLDGSGITDSGISEICELGVAWLTLNGGSITDATATKLSQPSELYGIILNNAGLSEAAIAKLRTAKPDATITVDGASE